MALPKGSWEGSATMDADIAYLRHTRRLSLMEVVEARAPDRETLLAPREGEVVVLYIHYACGFGLPTSLFFRRFLDFFVLQPQHLRANAVLQLTAFAVLCEGYLELLPYTELWCRLF